ncbi:MAG: dihydroorotate dehydrogenase (quinone) [Candidatus Levybacteria bacterium RIFCSPHIGHO2_01_FULL_40_15b]|nr:MAG: dihydroorotate dehydrogenase (quinone) [Candidatus Levybacteria bacterium RIFCSPHIGHO2_01_FULL_40_15b]
MSVEIRSAIDAAHRNIVHPYLTRGEAQNDREIAHERALKLMEMAQRIPLAVEITDRMFSYDDPILRTSFAGLEAPNPLGIAAGFDKNARVHRFLGQGLGFGTVTVGSIAKVEYGGNARPRIFDLPNSRGLINRMSFPGEGSRSAVETLRADRRSRPYLLIVNFAASRPSFDAGRQIEDYGIVSDELADFGDEGEANVSSPNTPGVRGLQETDAFSDLADVVIPVYLHRGKPVRFKFGPDLETEKLHKNAQTIIDKKGSGITITNTSTGAEIRKGLSGRDVHREEQGGISGLPITQKALEASHRLYDYIGDEIPIHRIGGIMNVRDVWDALTYGGATTVDVYTAFVRQETSTPNFAYYILRDLVKAMRAYGMTSMADFKGIRGKRVPFPKT